jgi:FG-GAP-like repeat
MSKKLVAHALAVAPIAVALLLMYACATSPPPVAVADADEPGDLLVAPAPTPAAVAPAGPQPPDGVWLTDDAGLRYFVDKLAKSGPFLRLGGDQVRTRWGIDITVDHEDDEFFYYRVYQTQPTTSWEPAGPTPQEIAALKASYLPETQPSDALRFVRFDAGLPSSGQWRHGFEIADMNEDGHLDIVHSPARKTLAPPAIFLGDGAGQWRRFRGTSFPRLAYDYGDVAVGDLNGDGHLDLVLAVHLRGLLAIIGDGAGGFKEWGRGLDFQVASAGSESGYSSRAVTLADWNGDGRPDILAMGEGPRPSSSQTTKGGAHGPVLFVNQGDGLWKRYDQGTDGQQAFGDGIVARDFNADGRPDFATASSAMGNKTLLYLNLEGGRWQPTEIGTMRGGSLVRSIAADDFNGDGRTDLAVGYLAYEAETWRSGLDVYLASPSGTWQRRVLAAEDGRDGVTGLGSGDLNGDGRRDLVASTGAGKYMVFLGKDGGWTRETSPELLPYDGGCRGYSVGLADFDEDGKDEFVAAFAGEPSAMYAPTACLSEGGIQVWRVESQ